MVAFRSATSGDVQVGTTSVVVTKPAGVVDGDGLIVAIFHQNSGGTPTITPPSGWTLVGSATDATATTWRLIIYKKVAASEGASWTWTLSSSQIFIWECSAYQGVASNVVEANTISASGETGTTQTAPAVTTLSGGAMVVSIAAYTSNDTGVTATPPGGMTERVDRFSILQIGLTAADVVQAAAGSSGTKAFTIVTGFSTAHGVTASLALTSQPPTVSAVSPAYGVIAGGTPISIAGTNFQALGYGANTVTVGGVACTSVVTVSDTQITCVTGAHAVGNVSVVVTNSNGSGTL